MIRHLTKPPQRRLTSSTETSGVVNAVGSFLFCVALVAGWLIVDAFEKAVKQEEEVDPMGRKRKARGKVLRLPEKEESQEREERAPSITTCSITIDRMVHHKIMHWVHKATGEVSGLGKVVKENGSFKVIDAMLLPQENTSGSTELDGRAIAKAMFILKDAPGHLNYWWHSHGHMDTFWSKTDTDTMEEFAGNRPEGGWCVATVFNKAGHMKSAVCLNAPFAEPIRILIDDLPTHITTFLKPEVFKGWDEEYEKNCKDKTYHYQGNHGWPPLDNDEDWVFVAGAWRLKAFVEKDALEKAGRHSHFPALGSGNKGAHKTPWEDPPKDWEIAQGHMMRWSVNFQLLRRFGLMPDGRLLLQTWPMGTPIPLTEYDEDYCHANQPPGVPRKDDNPGHPMFKEKGQKIDEDELREKIKGKDLAEIMLMSDQGTISDEELDILWKWPHIQDLREDALSSQAVYD